LDASSADISEPNHIKSDPSLGSKTTALDAQPIQSSIPEIQASVILDYMRAGQAVDYDGVIIEGDLNVGKRDLEVSSPVRIVNSTFRGDVFLGKAAFEKAVDMRGSTFEGNVSFTDAWFMEDASFVRSSFKRTADFRVTKIDGLAAFTGARFSEDASFTYAQVGKVASFMGAIFENDTDFNNVQFGGEATFMRSRFSKEVYFQYSKFMGVANFVGAFFGGNATFVGVRFDSDVIFRSSQFEKDAFFGLANFMGFSDFSGTRFQGLAVFAVTKFNDNARFVDASFAKQMILESARIYSIQLENTTFGPGAKISLRDADFTRLTAKWSTISGKLLYDPAAYLALVKNYQNLEWRDDANDCYYSFRRISQSQEGWGIEKVIDVVAWLSCGYGVKPLYTVIWSVTIIVIFGLVYWLGGGLKKGSFEEAEEFYVRMSSQKRTSDMETHPRILFADAIHYSSMMFTSQSPSNMYSIGVYRHVAMIEGLIGWFLMGLFVVVLSGLLIR
jgi:hypothetical protein